MRIAHSGDSSIDLWIHGRESSPVTQMAISNIPKIEAVTLPGIGTL
jgi:hypothetical protein